VGVRLARGGVAIKETVTKDVIGESRKTGRGLPQDGDQYHGGWGAEAGAGK